jgi:hypothetical protein
VISIDLDFMRTIQPLKLNDEIRIGSSNDGGYVVPERVLVGSKTLLSFGYGHDFLFEKEFLKYGRGNRAFLFDKSITLTSLIVGLLKSFYAKIRGLPTNLAWYFHCLLNYMGLRLHRRLKYFPRELVRYKVNRYQSSLISSLSLIDMQEESILKMDIEGAEYSVLDSIDLLREFRSLVVEFHFVAERTSHFQHLIQDLKKHFCITHVHINNNSKVLLGIPNVLEITFVNKTLVEEFEMNNLKLRLPTSLDRPCNPSIAEFVVDF